jgi:hypothetical protein
MRMIVRVDKTGHQQLFGCIDRLIDHACAKLGDRFAPLYRLRNAGTDSGDQTVDDQEV